MNRIVVLALLFIFSSAAGAQSQPNSDQPSVEAVCSFITGKMMAAIPQVPTVCTDGTNGANVPYLVLNVFSPTDALEGKMRRAWSGTLFAAMQELYFEGALGGVCDKDRFDYKTWLGCNLVFSDAYISRHSGAHYSVQQLPGIEMMLRGDSSSDKWYQQWWQAVGLAHGLKFDRPSNKSQAEYYGKRSCDQYIAAIENDPFRIASPKDMVIPVCSILLAADSSVSIVVDFPDFVRPTLVNYAEPLVRTFGQTFSDLPFNGEVIFRSPWATLSDGREVRYDQAYDLYWLGFLWSEVHSGVREAPNASGLALTSSSAGQVDKSKSDGGSGLFLKSKPSADGRTLIYLTRGTAWYVSTADFDKCHASVGDSALIISVRATDSTGAYTPTLSMGDCTISKTIFAQAW